MASTIQAPEDAVRNVIMAYDYIHGKTLQEIGEKNGITRERVRQVLARIGVTAGDGGATVRALVKARYATSGERRDATCLRVYGCGYAEAKAINGGALGKIGSPALCYKTQRGNAKVRGIAWEITLPEWWRVWHESGRWSGRGRGHGYVMARIGDTGPYSADNVEIITGSQNSKDSYIKTPSAIRTAKAKATLRAKAINQQQVVA